jgi:hypothetical protein
MDERRSYRRFDMDILATNNRSCLHLELDPPQDPTFKKISAVENSHFELLFPQKIREAILTIFFSRHSLEAFCALHVFRMGFNFNQKSPNPIVILLLVEPDALSPNQACSMVTAMDSAVFAAGWKGER